jgi:hypothetical protein
MFPALATRLAVRAWPWRVRALAISVVALGLVAASMSAGLQWPTQLAFTLAGPVVGLSWAVLCLASWFHPENGTLSPKARTVGRLPHWLQASLRWYASVFLALFALFCAVAWPAFSLSSLWHLAK